VKKKKGKKKGRSGEKALGFTWKGGIAIVGRRIVLPRKGDREVSATSSAEKRKGVAREMTSLQIE